MFRELLFSLEALAYLFLKVMACVFLLVIFVNAGPIAALLVAIFGVAVYFNYKKHATKERFYERYADAPTASFKGQQVATEPLADESEYKVVIEASKKLEGQLAELNAVGKGLHEKVTSVQNDLPNELVTLLRRVATVRNKLVHEEDFSLSPRQVRDFKNWFEDANEDLDVIINGGNRMSAGQLSTTPDKRLLDEDDVPVRKPDNTLSESQNETMTTVRVSHYETRQEVHTRKPIETESDNVLCFTCGYRGVPTYIKEGDVIRYSCCAQCSEILKVHGWYNPNG